MNPQFRHSEVHHQAQHMHVCICRMTPCVILQDVVAGDGTTSVTVICGALLQKCLDLLARGIHPTVVSDAFAHAAMKAGEVGPLQALLPA